MRISKLESNRYSILTGYLLLIVIIAGFMAGCSNADKIARLPVEEKMRLGDEEYADEDWADAIDYYKSVVFERNAAFTPEAQLKLANCYFFQDNYTDARFEYEELIRLFPDFRDLETAFFNIGVCYYQESLPAQYTQEETESAIEAFEVFLEKYPFSSRHDEAQEYIDMCTDKLWEKTYYNGYIYYMMYDYSAAIMYLDEVTAVGKHNDFDRKAWYYKAKMYLKREDKINSRKAVGKLVERYPESSEARRMQKKLDRLLAKD